MKIYVPDLENYKCFVVQSEGVIRAYEKIPANNTDVNYRDYYINSSYIYKDGSSSFGSYYNLPVCLARDNLTSDVFYRNDIDKILIIFLIMCIFNFYIPIKIFSKLFKKGGL